MLYDKTIQWSTQFENSNRFTQGNNGVGTAGVTFGASGVNITKGDQPSGAAYVYDNLAYNNYSVFDRNPEWFAVFATQATAGSSYEAYITFGLLATTGTVDPNNNSHMGFRISCVNGTRTLYATSALGGTTADQTAITLTSGSLDDVNTFYAKMTSGIQVDFYVNGSLRATHTNSLPTGDGPAVFAATIKGTVGNSADLIQVKQAGFEFAL